MPSILLINPAADVCSYFTAEAYDEADGGWVQVADLTIATLAAFVPADWSVRLVDEAISPVDMTDAADFIGITGKITQRARMIELAGEFRRRGRTVLIGGSFASLSPDEMRPHADILVTGEIEEIAAALFADLGAGDWRPEYAGGKMVDITLSPTPRWDLYPVARAQAGALQTTRGCPFACEFCDVIQYQGRKQRHKTVEQVVRELEVLYAAGFRNVFIVDDNFTVHRRWAHTILETLRDWNAAHSDEPMRFSTQASLDIARDTELLALCQAAGMQMFFVGVETMNEASLRETGKRQNLLMPMAESIGRILHAGIAIQAGVIAGFDHDTPEIFDDLFEFLQLSPLPFASVGVLTAPEATDLHRRLQREGRLLGPAWSAGAGVFETNIVPLGMTRAALTAGVKALCGRLYAAPAFEQRMMNLIAAFGDLSPAPPLKPGRRNPRSRLFFQASRKISARGQAERDMLSRVLEAAVAKPAIMWSVMAFFVQYEQIRYFLDLNHIGLDADALTPIAA
jgi:radical SAM superfamily enzyme YgiQ (UPF0313 family)